MNETVARKTEAVAAPPLFQWTVERFHRAIDTGVFGEDDRVELVNGVLYEMVPPKPPHAGIKQKLANALARALDPNQYTVRNEDPIILAPDSEPEPDVVVAQGAESEYLKRHPCAKDVLLVIEVSDTTLKYDRGEKLRMYARAGIPEYWVVSIPDQTVQAYQNPKGASYGETDVLAEGTVRTLRVQPSVSVNVDELFAGLES